MKPVQKIHPQNQQRYQYEICDYPITTFLYEEYGAKGVGKNRLPIINMDHYRDTSIDQELHEECCIGMALAGTYDMSMFPGPMIPEELARLNNKQNWENVLLEIDRYDPEGIHRRALQKIIETVQGPKMYPIYRYVYFAMGVHIPWFFHLMLKNGRFMEKGIDKDGYTDHALYFPKLKEYVKTLPFKEIGRIMIFGSYPNAGVTIHRDSNVAENKDHSINFFFDGWRPSFIWDEVKKEKYYLEKGAKSYFFNDRDYHGVDPESTFRYTLRVDGTFTDEMCEKLNMEDGYTFKWEY